jgi:hypothetical protein
VARRERDDCGAHVDVFGATLLQHRTGSPTRVEIAPTSAERLEDYRLQAIPGIGRWMAAPRLCVRLLDGNDPVASSASTARS